MREDAKLRGSAVSGVSADQSDIKTLSVALALLTFGAGE